MRRRALVVAILSLSFAAGAFAQELVVVLEGTKQYHRPGCERLEGRTDVLAMQRAQAEARGFRSHPECDPARVPPAPKAVMVTVDDGAKYYHRDKCERLGKSPRKISLEEAAKKHWPCPACKPPIRPRKKSDG